MWLYFYDESGNEAIPLISNEKSNIFTLGGFFISTSEWHFLNLIYKGIRAKYNIDENIELKWKHLIRQKYPVDHLTKKEVINFLIDLFNRIESIITIVTVVIRKNEAYQKKNYVNNQYDIYNTGILYSMQRFGSFLEDKKEKGIVIGDSKSESENKKIRKFFASIKKYGTFWVRIEPIIIENVLLQTSHYSPGIQIADFIVGMIHQKYRDDKPKDSTYFNIIKPMLRKKPGTNDWKGWGIVHFP